MKKHIYTVNAGWPDERRVDLNNCSYICQLGPWADSGGVYHDIYAVGWDTYALVRSPWIDDAKFTDKLVDYDFDNYAEAESDNVAVIVADKIASRHMAATVLAT